MLPRLTPEDFQTAIAWLESNEGEDGEADACVRVAKFLRHEANKRLVAKVAQQTGAGSKRARAALAERGLLIEE